MSETELSIKKSVYSKVLGYSSINVLEILQVFDLFAKTMLHHELYKEKTEFIYAELMIEQSNHVNYHSSYDRSLLFTTDEQTPSPRMIF